MPDDITPEPTGDVPSGDGGENTETPESWDTATQATPADTTRSGSHRGDPGHRHPVHGGHPDASSRHAGCRDR